jgi:hypothetical protein
MSPSRILALISLIGGLASALAGVFAGINPKVAAALTGLAVVIASVTERVQGGLSTK